MLPEYLKEQWWMNNPDDLLAYIYWLKDRLPPSGDEERKASMLSIAKQLDYDHPCPQEERAKWGLDDED